MAVVESASNVSEFDSEFFELGAEGLDISIGAMFAPGWGQGLEV